MPDGGGWCSLGSKMHFKVLKSKLPEKAKSCKDSATPHLTGHLRHMPASPVSDVTHLCRGLSQAMAGSLRPLPLPPLDAA